VLASIEDTRQLRTAAAFLRDVTYPKGSVKMVGVRHSVDQSLVDGLTAVSRQLRSEQISTTWSVVDQETFEHGFLASMRATGDGPARSNIVFLAFPRVADAERHAAQVRQEAGNQELRANWGGDLNLVTAIDGPDELQQAEQYLHGLADLARLPGPPGVHVISATFVEALPIAPFADLSVFALSPDVDFAVLRRIIDAADTPCAFVRDSGAESAFV
jgi:hypothetical protein